jgi:hypothetical protein
MSRNQYKSCEIEKIVICRFLRVKSSTKCVSKIVQVARKVDRQLNNDDTHTKVWLESLRASHWLVALLATPSSFKVENPRAFYSVASF